MVDPIEVVTYDPQWPELFRETAVSLHTALGSIAMRIDHIGSTAIPGCAAKPVIDVQISVAAFEPFHAILQPMQSLGYRWRADNPDLTKRYFREAPGARRTHIHVRKRGSWSQQFALLFRDYLRRHAADRDLYAAVKQQLSQAYRHDRTGYVEAKSPIIWAIMRRANTWSQATGWEPGAPDI